MNSTEIKAMVKLLAGLFKTTTPEQLAFLGERFKGREKKIVEAAIKTHAATHEFLDIPNLLEGIRASTEREQAKLIDRDKETIVHWLKRTMPGTFGQMDNLAALRKHFIDSMKSLAQANDDHGRGEVMSVLRGHAATAYREIGFDADAVKELLSELVLTDPDQQSAKLSEGVGV